MVKIIICVKTVIELINCPKTINSIKRINNLVGNNNILFFYPRYVDYDVDSNFVKSILNNLNTYKFYDEKQKIKFVCTLKNNNNRICYWQKNYRPLNEMNKILIEQIVNRLEYKGDINEFKTHDIYKEDRLIFYADLFHQRMYEYVDPREIIYRNINDIVLSKIFDTCLPKYAEHYTSLILQK